MRAPVLLAILATACGGGGTSDPGLRARFRVDGATLIEGPLPEPAEGPRVTATETTQSRVRIGRRRNILRGALERGARAVALGIPGDFGYWIVPAGPPDVATPDDPTFDVVFALAPGSAPGPFEIRALAIDDASRVGPAATVSLEAQAVEDPDAEAPLVVRLTWDTNADLDLHVFDAAGIEIWARNLSSYQRPAPGEPADPSALAKAGVLDIDSNAACVIDGRREERVVWREAAPPGSYRVQVDAFSLCGEAAARWTVEALEAGILRGRKRGIATDADTRAKHDAGAGIHALDFEVARR